MRIDLVEDIQVARRYALINLEAKAHSCREGLMTVSSRADLAAAAEEAKAFLALAGKQPFLQRAWINAEQAANAAVGKLIDEATAANLIVDQHYAWATKAAKIHAVVRVLQMKIEAATTIREIHDAVAQAVWPKFGEVQ